MNLIALSILGGAMFFCAIILGISYFRPTPEKDDAEFDDLVIKRHTEGLTSKDVKRAIKITKRNL